MKRKSKMIPLARNATLIVPVPASERVKELNTLKALDVTEFNSQAEAEFITLVSEFVREREGNPPRVREVLAETAFELNVSIETAKRYLLKHTARRAEFQVTDGKVGLREH